MKEVPGVHKHIKKTIIDKIWNFFSSVKVGVTLIVIALIASAIGTILPQEMYIPSTATPAEHYELEYGWFGMVYYELGFHNLYSSWWYLIIIGMLGISLLIASIDRFFPLYRSLKKQGVTRHDGFMKRQRIYGVTKLEEQDINLEEVKGRLKKAALSYTRGKRSYTCRKRSFFMLGTLCKSYWTYHFLNWSIIAFRPGMYIDKVLWLREGERKEIPGTNGEYYLQNNDFTLEVYDKESEEDKQYSAAIDKTGTIAKHINPMLRSMSAREIPYQGEKVDLDKLKDYKIKVNEPLKHDHYALYQVDYKLDELSTMAFNLINKKNRREIWQLKG
ncbi:cytochrome c biogenesis protein ResB [Peribacillus frigoritolerans]|nr:cytochrome c biogenesis protein ResB [Peribacillus frigoritolerans]